MTWISVKDRLPKANERYLGYCYNEFDSNSWTGIVDVFLDPQTGWKRCENDDEKPVSVLYWHEMIEVPKV